MVVCVSVKMPAVQASTPNYPVGLVPAGARCGNARWCLIDWEPPRAHSFALASDVRRACYCFGAEANAECRDALAFD